MNKLNDLKGQTQLPLYDEARMSWGRIHERVSTNATYTNITICDEWYTFSNFYNWYVDNVVEGWQLDKDMKGGNIYSPENSIFIPQHINLLFRSIQSPQGKGVSRTKSGKYQAQAHWEGMPHKFGTWDTPEEATNAYEKGRKQYLYNLSVQYNQYEELSTVLYKLSK